MKAKSLVLCASLCAVSVAMGILAATATRMFKANSVVKYAEKDITLEFNASNLSDGSGTVTLNGNLFTYENITVGSNQITLNVGSRIYANQNSGASVGANGLKGVGFTNVIFVGGLGGTATISVNSNPYDIVVYGGSTYNQTVENNAFDLSITTGTLILSKIALNYACAYDEAPEKQKVLFVGSDNMSVTSWKTAYTEAVNAIEGATAECSHFTTGSFSFLQIGDLEHNYANKAQEYRDLLASERWDAVYFQLSRRLTPSGTNLLSHEHDIFLDVVVPITKEVTSNITLLAMEATENPTIFDYNEEDGQPISTGNTESKTVEEMTEFMENLASDWAYEAGIKVANYASVYNYCGTVGSNNDTRTKAKAYARGLMAYATINETHIPDNIATTWASTVFPSTSSTAKSIKNDIGAKVNEAVFG